MKKIISLILCLAMMLALPVFASDAAETAEPSDPAQTAEPSETAEPAEGSGAEETEEPAEAETVTVSLRVEGISENLAVWKDAQVAGKAGELTAADAVRALVGEENYVETEGPYGVYFTSLYGEEEGLGAYGGWNYCVNGQSPSVSMGQYVLEGGEDIVVYYGDLNTLYPAVAVEEGVLTLTASGWQEGEDGEWVQVESPIPGVTVYWDGEELGQTGEDGSIALPQDEPGEHSVQIRKDGEAIEGEEGRFMPAVVRLAADTTVTVEPSQIFTDLPADHRAYQAVTELYEAGVVGGKGNGLFGTEDVLTRAEAVVMLYRLAGEPVTTEPAGQALDTGAWYYDAANWAISLNIFQREGVFDPNAAVTGGELASYIAIYSEQAVTPPRDLMHENITRGDAAIMLTELL